MELTDKAFNTLLKWGFIALAVIAFFYSNLFSLFVTAFFAIIMLVLATFFTTWFISGERPKWFAKNKKKEKS